MGSRRIVLLGATGYTGRRVLRELLERGAEPTLAGRSRARMRTVADRFGVDLPAAEEGFAYRPPRPGASPRLVDERAAQRVRMFHHAGVRRATMTVPGSEHLGLPELFPQLESVDVGLGGFGRWTRPVQIAAALQSPLLRSARVRSALTRLSGRLPGAHRDPDSDGRSLVIAVARDDSGRHLARTALTGPDPYEMTGSLLAWGAVRAAAPDAVLKPGAHGPVAAFGLDTLALGAAEAGVHEVTEASDHRP
ncbi:hypothetical protein [Streptomyces sp. NPDC047061]|uniref:hypothetical protein n=1 Tax=Streptomyces sp. NPDC047061 TaxID=3154605 RepID=UPI0033FE9FF8